MPRYIHPVDPEDIWAEHWRDLMELDISFTPADVYLALGFPTRQTNSEIELNPDVDR
jgi:hypothetical protein